MKRSVTKVLILLVLFGFAPWSLATSLTQVAKELVAESTSPQVFEGDDGWLFLKEELQHIAGGKFWGESSAQASRSTRKEHRDPVPAITAYNRSLVEKGITLYLMVVPPKALVYAHKLNPAITSTQEQTELYRNFYQALEKQGVKTIDLLPKLQDMAKGDDSLYCRTDTHYSPAGMLLFAQEAARAIKRESWYQAPAAQQFELSAQQITITGDLARIAGSQSSESITIQLVKDRAAGTLLESDMASPVILLGDSHTLVFNSGGELHATGAGLFDNLSAELGFAVDLLGVRGSGATPARIGLYQRSKKNSNYLAGKKVVIWCFAARELTGTAGWRTIPVSP